MQKSWKICTCKYHHLHFTTVIILLHIITYLTIYLCFILHILHIYFFRLAFPHVQNSHLIPHGLNSSAPVQKFLWQNSNSSNLGCTPALWTEGKVYCNRQLRAGLHVGQDSQDMTSFKGGDSWTESLKTWELSIEKRLEANEIIEFKV